MCISINNNRSLNYAKHTNSPLPLYLVCPCTVNYISYIYQTAYIGAYLQLHIYVYIYTHIFSSTLKRGRVGGATSGSMGAPVDKLMTRGNQPMTLWLGSRWELPPYYTPIMAYIYIYIYQLYEAI